MSRDIRSPNAPGLLPPPPSLPALRWLSCEACKRLAHESRPWSEAEGRVERPGRWIETPEGLVGAADREQGVIGESAPPHVGVRELGKGLLGASRLEQGESCREVGEPGAFAGGCRSRRSAAGEPRARLHPPNEFATASRIARFGIGGGGRDEPRGLGGKNPQRTGRRASREGRTDDGAHEEREHERGGFHGCCGATWDRERWGHQRRASERARRRSSSSSRASARGRAPRRAAGRARCLP